MDRKQLEVELSELRKMRKSLDERISFFESELQQRHNIAYKIGQNGHLYSGVAGADLKPYIQEWIDSGHTLVALAEKCMLDESTVGKIMTNPERMVRVTTADAILTGLGVSPSVLNDLVPEPPESKYYEE